MERYRRLFDRSRRVFMPFLTLGDPDVATSERLVRAAIEAGADALELGFPFSDPIADGPVIQRSATRALQAGFRVDEGFALIERVRRDHDVPIGLLLYSNLVFRRGVDAFLARAHGAGVDGILAADVPIEEATELAEGCRRRDLAPIFMVAPSTSDARVRRIAELVGGFVYVVARLGVTGARSGLSDTTVELVRRIRELTAVPLVVGFGLSSPEHVATVLDAGADGAIIGSALTAAIERQLDDPDRMEAAVRELVSSVRQTIDRRAIAP